MLTVHNAVFICTLTMLPAGANGQKVFDAPHVGGTNGVYMGANGGGNGWAPDLSSVRARDAMSSTDVVYSVAGGRASHRSQRSRHRSSSNPAASLRDPALRTPLRALDGRVCLRASHLSSSDCLPAWHVTWRRPTAS